MKKLFKQKNADMVLEAEVVEVEALVEVVEVEVIVVEVEVVEEVEVQVNLDMTDHCTTDFCI